MQQEDDEDYLFEFDLDSHDSSDTGDEEEGEHTLGEQRVAQQENEEGQVGEKIGTGEVKYFELAMDTID